jgi:hypothetical protein
MPATRSLQTVTIDAIFTFENVIFGANKLSLGYPSALLCIAATNGSPHLVNDDGCAYERWHF